MNALVASLWDRWHLVIEATGVAILVAAVLTVGLSRWRVRRGMSAEQAWRRSLAETGIVVGTLPWTWMALTPMDGQAHIAMTPLVDLANQLTGPPGEAFYQIVANLAFLLPFGALLPLRWSRLGNLWFIGLIAAGYSAAIEVLQFLLDLGRVSSIDDVLINAVGAVIGAALTRRRWSPRGDDDANDDDVHSGDVVSSMVR